MGEMGRREVAGSILGVCPTCETPIPSTRTLIEYETPTGEHRVFADCPNCRSVVHPRTRGNAISTREMSSADRA